MIVVMSEEMVEAFEIVVEVGRFEERILVGIDEVEGIGGSFVVVVVFVVVLLLVVFLPLVVRIGVVVGMLVVIGKVGSDGMGGIVVGVVEEIEGRRFGIVEQNLSRNLGCPFLHHQQAMIFFLPYVDILFRKECPLHLLRLLHRLLRLRLLLLPLRLRLRIRHHLHHLHLRPQQNLHHPRHHHQHHV